MGYGDVLSPEVEGIITQIMDGAFRVHRALGPGLLESVYETCLFHELTKMGLKARRQVPVTIQYDGINLAAALTLDILVEDCVVVELKAVEKPNRLYEAQLLTYLKLTGKKVGLLMNFNVPVFKDGFKRMLL